MDSTPGDIAAQRLKAKEDGNASKAVRTECVAWRQSCDWQLTS